MLISKLGQALVIAFEGKTVVKEPAIWEHDSQLNKVMYEMMPNNGKRVSKRENLYSTNLFRMQVQDKGSTMIVLNLNTNTGSVTVTSPAAKTK